MSQDPKKQYGAYKVSEYTHSDSQRAYKVDESDGVPARAETDPNAEMMRQLEEMSGDMDYRKKHTKENTQESSKTEYQNTRQALKNLSPF